MALNQVTHPSNGLAIPCSNLHNLHTEVCSEIMFQHRSHIVRPNFRPRIMRCGATGELSPRGDQVDVI